MVQRLPIGALVGASAALHAGLFVAVVARHEEAPRMPAPGRHEVAIEVQETPRPEDLAGPSLGVAAARGIASPRAIPRSAARPSVRPQAAPPQTAQADEATPQFTIAIGASSNALREVGSSGAKSSRADASGEPVPEGLVDEKARLVYGVSPSYPDVARVSGIEGRVRLELVVGTGGSVERSRVVGSVAPSLDEAALDAARRFRFDPATKAGRPVRVRMAWTVEFRLRAPGP